MEEKREIIYSDLSSASRKQPYDAMVYIEGTSVIAVDSNGKVIARGTAGTDDATVIQAAIDAGGNRLIRVKSGVYTITTTIQLNNDYTHVTGDGVKTTRFNLMSNTPCFEIYNSRANTIENIFIQCTPSQTDDAVRIRCEPPVGHVGGIVSANNALRHIYIRGSSIAHTFTAISFYAKGSADSHAGICFITLENINLELCNRGIAFYEYTSRYSAPDNDWINGITVNNLTLNRVGIGVDFTDIIGKYRCQDFIFTNVYVQTGPATEYVFKNITGYAHAINHSYVWDWPESSSRVAMYQFHGDSSDCILNISKPMWMEASDVVVDNGGSNNTINYTRSPIKYVRSDGFGDYTTVHAALAAITDASSTNRYVICVIGNITETATISAKSHIDVIGIGSVITSTIDSDNATITFTDVTDCHYRDLSIVRSGTSANRATGIRISGTSDESCKLTNVHVTNTATSAECFGLQIIEMACPTIINSAFSAQSGTYGFGLDCGTSKQAIIDNCVFVGWGVNGYGAIFRVNGNPIITNSRFYGSASGSNIPGAFIYNTASPTFENCTFVGGAGGENCHAALVLDKSAPEFLNCKFCAPTYNGIHTFTGDNATIQPISGHPYYTISGYLYVTTAGTGGSILDIGTTPGGTEIASGIATDSTGYKYYTGTSVAIASDSPIYLTFSDTNTRATLYYNVGYNYNHCNGLLIATTGNCLATGCTIESNFNSTACYITTAARVAGNFRIVNCHLASAGSYDLQCESLGNVPVHGCTFRNSSFNAISFPGRGVATLLNTTTSVVVAHGCSATPTNITVTPGSIGNATKWYVDTIGATNFTIHVDQDPGADITFYWRAEV